MVRAPVPAALTDVEQGKTPATRKYKEVTRTIKYEGRYVQADDKKIKLAGYHPNNKTKLKKSLVPGAVVIILSGRFQGFRAVFLKQLDSGLILVSGPYETSGVPLRRLNQAYVIGTSTVVDVSKVDVSKINDDFFARVKAPKEGEEGFFSIAEKINPKWLEDRAKVQAAVDAPLKASIEKVPQLSAYLKSKFSINHGDAPHLMKF